MKIGPKSDKKIRTNRSTTPAKSGKANTGRSTSKGGAKSDHVDISVHAREVQEALELATSAPEVRTEKVAPLKAAVEDGTYHRPSEDIAEKIVEEMKSGPR